jgi:hypothetical protein
MGRSWSLQAASPALDIRAPGPIAFEVVAQARPQELVLFHSAECLDARDFLVSGGGLVTPAMPNKSAGHRQPETD